jgi:hypothetical protein
MKQQPPYVRGIRVAAEKVLHDLHGWPRWVVLPGADDEQAANLLTVFKNQTH